MAKIDDKSWLGLYPIIRHIHTCSMAKIDDKFWIDLYPTIGIFIQAI